MKILIILTLILGINFCSAQSVSEKKLIGKWIFVVKTNNLIDDIGKLEENNSNSESQ